MQAVQDAGNEHRPGDEIEPDLGRHAVARLEHGAGGVADAGLLDQVLLPCVRSRSARADRFFNQDEILQKLPEFVRQFSW